MDEVSANLRKEFIACIPSLRAFAASLVGVGDKADDLVQEALMKGWGNLDSFTEGTNVRAWLFTILRNAFYSTYRKTKREVQDTDGIYSGTLAEHPQQDGHLDLADFRLALDQLPGDQREALILIGASGFSYEEAAEICGCAIGTVKSRVNRARAKLAELLGVNSADEYGPEKSVQAIISTTTTTAVKSRAIG